MPPLFKVHYKNGDQLMTCDESKHNCPDALRGSDHSKIPIQWHSYLHKMSHSHYTLEILCLGHFINFKRGDIILNNILFLLIFEITT